MCIRDRFISSIILFRRRRNADAKAAKRRQRVKARQAEKPQKHRERKPKSYEDEPYIPEKPGQERPRSAPAKAKKPQMSMAEMIAKELADIESEQ